MITPVICLLSYFLRETYMGHLGGVWHWTIFKRNMMWKFKEYDLVWPLDRVSRSQVELRQEINIFSKVRNFLVFQGVGDLKLSVS